MTSPSPIDTTPEWAVGTTSQDMLEALSEDLISIHEGGVELDTHQLTSMQDLLEELQRRFAAAGPQ